MPGGDRTRRLSPHAALVLWGVLLSGCLEQHPPSPFSEYTDTDFGGAGGGGAGGGGGEYLGPPCDTDAECDDGVACTLDRCDDALGRCRATPDDSTCQNGVYCDGVEVCDLDVGCRLDGPISCSDDNVCTIDTCVEATQSCTHQARDADFDGDPDIHCGGGDCDDFDPLVSSIAPEICANGRDDDCDQTADEAACTTPLYDDCSDPLVITQPGSYPMSTAGAGLDVPSACVPAGAARDVVATVTLPPGPPVDVELTARTPSAEVSVAIATECGNPSSELSCGGNFGAPQGGNLAKTRGRALGDVASPTSYPVTVATSPGSDVVLEVAITPAEPAPTNETCGTALPIVPGVPLIADVVDAATDVATACPRATGELVFVFTLSEPRDVDVFGVSLDGDGVPSLSLRDEDCALPEDEITCHTAPVAHIFRHALPAGTYYVAASASAPTRVTVAVETSAPTPAPADESCAGAPLLAPNQTVPVSLGAHQDDVGVPCLSGAVDAAYELVLTETSDVLLVGRYSQGDTAAVELMTPPCADAVDLVECGVGNDSPVRGAAHAVPPGSYRVVVESALGLPLELTALVRPAVPPTLVPFADGCADAQIVPPDGGFFQGNTQNATAGFSAGCDSGGGSAGGAKDQLLMLTLDAPKRVVLDMEGSSYISLLDVRAGPACPGAEVPLGCSVGFAQQRSFLDLELDAGVYYLQVDGYAGGAGPWFLDVRVVDP